MAEFEPSPQAFAAYVASRNRVANWVKAHSPSHIPDYYSPSEPPSRVPSYVFDSTDAEEGDDEQDDESIYSVPPKMVLKYDDGRPDVIIEPMSDSSRGRVPRPAHIRSRSASQAPPFRDVRPTLPMDYQYAPLVHDYTPPTPEFPENIRILPPLSKDPVPRKFVDAPTRLNVAMQPVTSQERTLPLSSRPASPKMGHSQSEPLPFKYASNYYARPSYTQPNYTRKDGAVASSVQYAQPSARRSGGQPVYRSTAHTSQHMYPAPGVTFSHSAPPRLPSPHGPDSKIFNRHNSLGEPFTTGRLDRSGTRNLRDHGRVLDDPMFEEKHTYTRARSKSLPRAINSPQSAVPPAAPLVRPKSRGASSVHVGMYMEPRRGSRDTKIQREGDRGTRGRRDSISSSDTFYINHTDARKTDTPGTSTRVSPTSTKYSPVSTHSRSRPSTPGLGSFKKPFFQRIFSINKLFEKGDRVGVFPDVKEGTRMATPRLARRYTGVT